MELSHAVRTGVPASVVLLKYSAKNWPVGQALGPVMVNAAAFEATGPGLTTRTVAVPTVAMSAAAMLAVTCVGLTTVVGRADPFHSTFAPAAKPLPSTVSVKAGPPAIVLRGVRASTVGPPGGVAPSSMISPTDGTPWLLRTKSME